MFSEKAQKRRRDPETAAMIANCDVPIEEEPPKKVPKKAKKVEMNRPFFKGLTRDLDVGSANCLAESSVSNIGRRSNVNYKRTY